MMRVVLRKKPRNAGVTMMFMWGDDETRKIPGRLGIPTVDSRLEGETASMETVERL